MSGGCIACGGELRFFGPRDAYAYFECTRCDTIQLTPVPSGEELARAYREDYARAEHITSDPQRSRASTRTLHDALVNALKRHGARGRVLDYGAGWGGLVLRLRDADFDPIGYDLSQDMVKFCQAEGLPMYFGDIDAVAERDFDAMVLSSVFEHLNAPDAWLRAARERLKPGGLFVTTQPTAPFARTVGTILRLGLRRVPLPGLHRIFFPPWHIALYSLEGMRQVGERAGFECLEIVGAPQQRDPGFTGWVQRVLETFNRAGWALMKLRWPFFTGHIFVFRKR